MILILLPSLPSIAAALTSTTRKRAPVEVIHAAASLMSVVVGVLVLRKMWLHQEAISWHLLRADSLSAFMIAIVTFVGAVAGIYAIGYMRLEFDEGHFSRVRLFYTLF